MTYIGTYKRLYNTISLSTAQLTNLANDNHIQFDTISGNAELVSLSTGTGQSLGIITLKKGYYYLITCDVGFGPDESFVSYLLRYHPSDDSLVDITGCTLHAIRAGDSNAGSVGLSNPHQILVVDCTQSDLIFKIDKTAGTLNATIGIFTAVINIEALF